MTISTLLTITHDMSRGITIGDYTLRMYQLMFLLSFILGFQILKSILKREGANDKWMDPLLTYSVVATVIGARLGHVLFYQPEYYLKHPLEILMVWKGGLASHGAAIAIIIAMYLFSKKVSKTPLLWILDRIVIVVALAATFIRIGNFTNSEIYGKIDNSAVETVFLYPAQEYFTSYYGSFFYDVSFEKTDQSFEQEGVAYPIYTATFTTKENANVERIAQEIDVNIVRRLSSLDSEEQNILPLPGAKAEVISPSEIRVDLLGVPRYPTQLFEASAYLMIFIILVFLYLKTKKKFELGFLFGTFLTLLFGFRFFVEFYKANQVGFEDELTLNMGQILSIPLVLIGLYFVLTSPKRPFEYSKMSKNI